MVIDTSAVVAILQREPERRAFIEAIEAADARLMSVASFVEVSIVLRQEVYVRPFPKIDAGEWPISRGNGFMPVWSRDAMGSAYTDGAIPFPEHCRDSFDMPTSLPGRRRAQTGGPPRAPTD